jgi:hypothetical protein
MRSKLNNNIPYLIYNKEDRFVGTCRVILAFQTWNDRFINGHVLMNRRGVINIISLKSMLNAGYKFKKCYVENIIL